MDIAPQKAATRSNSPWRLGSIWNEPGNVWLRQTNKSHRLQERRVKTRRPAKKNASKETLRVRYSELLRLREEVERLEAPYQDRSLKERFARDNS
jgi:hypothetical protein